MPDSELKSGGVSLGVPAQRTPETINYNGSDLGKGYLPSSFEDQSGLEDYLNEGQGKAHTFVNWAGQSLGNALLGTVEAASYLGDWEQMVEKVKGSEQEYDNWMAKAMRDAKEQLKGSLPIYRSKEGQETFSPGSRSFWTSNSPDVIGSVLGLLVPGMVAGKVGKLGSALLGAGKELQAGAELASSVLTSRYAESTMEANQVFQDSYTKYVSSGMNPDEAREVAGQAASRTWNMNWLLAVQDLYQYNSILKGFKSAAKAKSLLGLAGEGAGVMISEGAEEGLQYIFAEEAKRAGADKGHGYFGDEFWSERLSDYIRSDEFKSNVTLGALGGGVFGGVGPLLSKATESGLDTAEEALARTSLGKNLITKQRLDIIESLAKERANLVNDFGTSKKIDNDRLAKNALNHLVNGKIENWKSQIEDLKKVPELDPDTRQTLDSHLEDIDELVNINAQVKQSKIPKNLQPEAVANNYDLIRSVKLDKALTKKLEDSYIAVSKDVLPASLLDLKKTQVNKDAISEIAKKEPSYVPLSALVNSQFQEALNLHEPDKKKQAEIIKQLGTPKDKELVNLTKQSILNRGHVDNLRKQISKYSTAEGVQELVTESNAKEQLKKVNDTLKKERVTLEEVQNLKKEPLSKEAGQLIDNKLNELASAKVEDNKKKVKEVTDVPIPTPDEKIPEPTIPHPDDFTPLFDDNGHINPEYELHPESALDPEEHLTPSPEPEISPEPTPEELLGLGESMKKKLTKQVTEETKRTAPAPRQDESIVKAQVKTSYLEQQMARSWVAELARKWVGKVQQYILDKQGYFTEQTYFAKNGEEKKASEVFATDKNGVLLINTPLVKAGQKVILKREDDSFVITKGFKPDNIKNWIINAYWIDENGKQIGTKPLFQLPSSDNPALSSKQQENNISIRKALEANGGSLTRTIQDKSIGARKASLNKQTKNSISILELDYMQDTFQRIPGGAILGYVGANNKFVFNGTRNRNNLPREVIAQLDDIQYDYATPIDRLRGAVLSARMSPNGTYRVESLDTRKLNDNEVAYVKNLIKGKKWSEAQKIVYISPKMKQELSTADDKALDRILSGGLRQVDFKLLHSTQQFTDPVTNQEYNSYYDFLKTVLTTTLQGSNTEAKGFENSYSYVMSTVYLDPHPSDIEVKVTQDPEKPKIEITQPSPKIQPEPVKIEEGKKESVEERRRRIAEEQKNKATTLTTEGVSFKLISEKELQWFRDNFGDEFLEVAKGVDSFMAANGVESFGTYHNALVTIAQFSPEGTAYHEAGHFVFDPKNRIITKLQREKILNEASKVYKLKRSEKNDPTLEERLMESFEIYKLSNGKVLPEVNKARNFFARLLAFIKKIVGFKTSIEKLFDKIDTPNFSVEQRQEFYKNLTSIYDPDNLRNKRLSGFNSVKVQNEALLSARTRAMGIASAVSSKLGYVKDILVERLPQILEETKKYYTDMANAILTIPEENRSDKQIGQLMVLHAMGVTPDIPGYEGNKGSWDSVEVAGVKEEGFKDKLLSSFTDLGFIVKYDQDLDEIEQKASKDHIHDLENTLVNPSSSISERVKLLLHSIPTPNVTREGKVEGNKKTILDEDLPLDFRKADAMLTLQLADSINPYQRLQNLAESNPIAKAFLDKLNQVRSDGDTQTFNEVMMKYRRDTVDKKTVIIQEDEYFIPEFERPTPESPSRGIKTTTKTIDANRQSVFRTILSDWEVNAQHVNFLTPDGNVSEALALKVKKLFTNLEQQRKEQPNAKVFDIPRAIQNFKEILKTMGVNPPEGFWKELSLLDPKAGNQGRQVNKRYQRLTGLLFGEKGVTLHTLLDGAEVNPFQDSGDNVLKRIAKASAAYYETSKTGAYLNENGDLEYPINLPSYNSRINNILRDNTASDAWITEFKRDDFYKGNAFLDLVSSEQERGKVRYYRLSAIRKSGNDPKMHKDRNDIDSMLMRFSVYFNNDNLTTPSKTALVPIGTPADKSKTGLFSLPKTKGIEESRKFLFNVLNNTVDNELVRIKNIRELQEAERLNGYPIPADIKNYNKGNQFLYIPSLNSIPFLSADMSKGEASPEQFNEAQRLREIAINNHIESGYNSFLSYLEKNDIVKLNRKEDGSIGSITNKRIPKDMIGANSPYKTIQSFLREYFYNDTAWRLEMSKVFMGDRAFYKNDQDYSKRAYQLETPGYIGYTEEDTNLVRAVFSSHTKDASEDIKSISSILEGRDKEKVNSIAQLYSNINKTDAQSLITIDGYRKFAKALGQWSDATHEVLYQIAWKHGVTARSVINLMEEGKRKEFFGILKNTSLQALKPFQYSQQSVQLPNGKVMIMKQQFKDSITPILPEFADVHKGYKNMLEYMKSNDIDIMSDAEAIKVGSYGLINMTWDEDGNHVTPIAEEWQKRNVKLEDIIFPQLLPDSKKEEISGTQFHKLVMGDIEDEGEYLVDGKKLTGKKLKEHYNNLWVDKLSSGAKRLANKLSTTSDFQFSQEPEKRIEQFKKLQTILKEELDQKDLNDNYRDGIQIVLNNLNTIDFTNPISFPQLSRPFESVFVKLFDKYITGEKSPGYTAVNSADLSTVRTSKSLEGKKIQKTDELSFIRNENGEITEAEIGLPIDFLREANLKYGEHILPSGRIIWSKLSKEQQKSLQFIAYRIPTSNKSSMAPVRVAIVTPSTLNNTILIPGEMTKQMGLDFDVDKTNLLRRVLDKEGKVDNDNIDNQLFEVYWSVLTDPKHIAAVLNPLTTNTLEGIADKYRELNLLQEVSDSPFYMVHSDVAVESKNREEKAKVGIASRAATAHSVLQMLGEEYIDTASVIINLERKGQLKLGNKYANDNSTLISENLGEIQQAALDAAKTPLLALFNITRTLMPTAETLAMFGYDLETITNFFMQPIVREWSKLYNEVNEKDWKVTEKMLDKYPNLKTSYTELLRGNKPVITKSALANNLSSKIGENVQLDALVLIELNNLRTLGKQLSNITNVLSLDTLSDTSNISSLISTREKVYNAADPNNAINLSPRVFEISDENPTTKRIATFYKYALEQPLNFTSQFFPTTSAQYNEARRYVMGALGISPTNEEVINKITQFTNFYKLQTGNLLNTALKNAHPLGEKEGHPAKRWSMTDPERSITDYFIKFLRKAKQDPTLKSRVYDDNGKIKNALLASLRVYPATRDGDMPTLGVVNSTDDNNNEVIGAWSDLLNSSSQELRVLAHDLARYAIYSTGFSYNPNSFVDLVPLEFWKQTGIDKIWSSSLTKDIDKEGLLINFVRNKYKSITQFPEFYISDSGKSETISSSGRGYIEQGKEKNVLNSFFIDKGYAKKVDGNLPRFVEVSGRLYEKNPIDTQKDKYTIQYRQLQPAGSRNLVEVTSDGRFKSYVPAYENLSSDPFKTSEDKTISTKGTKEPVKQVMEKKTVIAKPGVPITLNFQFATFDLGEFAGTTATKEKENSVRKNIVDNPTLPMAPGGESFGVAYTRVTAAMRNLVENHTPNTVIITHNTVYNLIKLWNERDRPTVKEMLQDKKFRDDYAHSKDAPHDKPYQLPGLDIFIVRHGEVEDNVAGNFRSPQTPLTIKGKKQAEETGHSLKKINPSELIYSGVARTSETAQIINSVLQGNEDKGTDKLTDCVK